MRAFIGFRSDHAFVLSGSGLQARSPWPAASSGGKSFGFKVAMNAARDCSAHAQNGLSSGSGFASLVTRTSTNSASSLRRLITSPTRLRRTPSLVRIFLYSETMSSLTSQVKGACSIQSRRNDALGFSISWSTHRRVIRLHWSVLRCLKGNRNSFDLSGPVRTSRK
jgi:hypothetical protein